MTLATQPLKPTVPPTESNGDVADSNHSVNHSPTETHREQGSSLSWLLFNIMLPLLILGVGAGVIRVMGTVEASARPGDDDSPAGRMRRLPPAEVTQVLSLESLNKPLELRVDGVVVPFREVQIATEVAGRIVKKSQKCEAGSFVNKGDLLVEIDDTDYQQDVERLTRMREQDYKALEEVDQELKNAKRLVDVAAQDVALQEREVKRLEAMPAGFASEGELDRAKKALLMAMQSRIGYDNQTSLLVARRSKLEAAERLATTELRSAEINLERTKIYSPVDGVVVAENAELNSFIQRGSAIITVEDISKAEVAVNLRMDQLQWILDQRREGATANTTNAAATPLSDQAGTQSGYSLPQTPAVIEYEIAGRSDKVYRWNGTLVRYSGIGLDSRSRTVPVVIVVDQPRQFEDDERTVRESTSPSPLVRGMFVNVRLLIQPKTSLVAIPADAIQPGNRVWQFIQDESVLSKAAAKTVLVDTTSEKKNAPAPAAVLSDVDFDASEWVAGRVVIREQVVPVDSLWLAFDRQGAATLESSEEASSKSAANADSSDRRYWVCEIPGEEVKGGDWIVRSPLGDFDSELAVRVPRSNMKAGAK
jgi:multidrug efflux pump subunit AcrA (membrane-fusion protein)